MGKSSGTRRKSRSALTKKVRERGRLPLSRLLTKYEEGEKVVINIDPGIHKAMPHKRYQGANGGFCQEPGVKHGEVNSRADASIWVFLWARSWSRDHYGQAASCPQIQTWQERSPQQKGYQK